MKQVGNTILAKGVNHILAKRDNSAWPKGSKLSGFSKLLKAKGIDVVFRHTADGRIYGATFIDHRTQSVFNGSRLGTNLSANALQEHFTLPYENEQPIPLTIPTEDGVVLEQELQGSGLFDEYGSGLGLMSGGGSSNEAQEAAFDRELRRKKKKRKGRNL